MALKNKKNGGVKLLGARCKFFLLQSPWEDWLLSLRHEARSETRRVPAPGNGGTKISEPESNPALSVHWKPAKPAWLGGRMQVHHDYGAIAHSKPTAYEGRNISARNARRAAIAGLVVCALGLVALAGWQHSLGNQASVLFYHVPVQLCKILFNVYDLCFPWL
jgi:hypothetical protein